MKKTRIFFFLSVLILFLSINLSLAAVDYYITLNINALETDSIDPLPIKLVSNNNSPITLNILESSTSLWSNTIIEDNVYGDNSKIVTGPVSLDIGNSYTLEIEFDEVMVGEYYYGSCVIDTTAVECTDCEGSHTTCSAYAEKTWDSNQNDYIYSYYHGSDEPGSLSPCNIGIDFGRCSEEIVDGLTGEKVLSFNLPFTV